MAEASFLERAMDVDWRAHPAASGCGFAAARQERDQSIRATLVPLR
jgi:hypothetical protein